MEYFDIPEPLENLMKYLKKKHPDYKRISNEQFNRAIISAIYKKPFEKKKKIFPTVNTMKDLEIERVYDSGRDIMIVVKDLEGKAVMTAETFEDKLKGKETEETVCRMEYLYPEIHEEMPKREVTNYLLSKMLVPEKKRTIEQIVVSSGVISFDQIGDMFDYYKKMDQQHVLETVKKKQKINKKQDPEFSDLLRTGIEPNPGPVTITTITQQKGPLEVDLTSFSYWSRIFDSRLKSARLVEYSLIVWGDGVVKIRQGGVETQMVIKGVYRSENRNVRLYIVPEYEDVRDLKVDKKKFEFQMQGNIERWSLMRTYELYPCTHDDQGEFLVEIRGSEPDLTDIVHDLNSRDRKSVV